MTSHHQSLASLVRANEFSDASSPAACVTSLHSLRASPALPPQHNTFIIDTHHLRDTFNITSFLHGSDFSATHVLPTRKRLVSHNIVCHRQDTFLVSHGIVPECLLHSTRQMSSIPRLSGQHPSFCADIHQHVPSLMATLSNELCVMAFTAILPIN